MSSFILVLTLVVGSLGVGQPEVPPAEAPAKEAVVEGKAALGSTLSGEERQEVLEDLERVLKRRAFAVGLDFEAWPSKLEEERDRLEQADEPAELASVVNRALAKYGVSHLRMSPPPKKPAPAGPGARQPGGRPGGRRGEAGGGVVENQTLTWTAGDVAVLRIRSFDDDQYDRAKIEGFFDEVGARATGVVLDLRGNGGGAVTALSHLLGMFLPEGAEVGVYVSREVARSYERAKGEKATDAVEVAAWTNRKFRVRRNPRPPVHQPVAVLLSRGSASASEIVAAGLREGCNAAIVGQPSAGKVMLSVHAKLAHGFELQLPTADYVTGRGRRLEGRPLRPDVSVPGGRGAGSETAVRVAADLLVNGL